MNETASLVIDDGGKCLTIRRLCRQLKAFEKLMKAYGADEVEIPHLHYDYEPPKKHNQEVTIEDVRRSEALESQG